MPAAATSTTLSPAELSYLHTSLSLDPPLRPDSRSPTDFRPLTAETDFLPTCNGSSHVSLSDGSEALVGVKADVQKTAGGNIRRRLEDELDSKMNLDDSETSVAETRFGKRPKGSPNWISLNIDISTLRDDDPLLIFLSEMLREPLLSFASGTSLADTLVINGNWHWHLHIDILLLSPFTASGTSYPLPLLSLATHLALRSTRLPKLKSTGEEDPLVDDDWESSVYLFPKAGLEKTKKKKTTGQQSFGMTAAVELHMPPITLLVMCVAENIIFDPSHAELAVADAVLAVSVGFPGGKGNAPAILAVRTIETAARDTMKGVPRSGEAVEGEEVPGVWRPRVGGVKRDILKRVVGAAVGYGEGSGNLAGGGGGVAREVFDGLESFLRS